MSPSQPPKLPDLARLAQESGLDKNVMAFLRESGVNTSGVLFHLFSKRERIAKTLQPLEAGVRVQGTNVKLDFVAMGVAVAVLEHMVDQIELARKAQFACGASTPTMTTSDASTSSAEDQKPPKVLPKGYWATVIQDFEKEVVAGQNRTFPSHQLVGAEEFVKQQQPIPEPQRLLTVLDAFESIRWSMIFARWGQEHQVNTLVDFFVNLTRDHPNKIPQIREYYKKTSWDLAMHMRAGGTFGSGVDKIV
ncbi:ftsH, partial [Symbiodinium pilosum]